MSKKKTLGLLPEMIKFTIKEAKREAKKRRVGILAVLGHAFRKIGNIKFEDHADQPVIDYGGARFTIELFHLNEEKLSLTGTADSGMEHTFPIDEISLDDMIGLLEIISVKIKTL